jgi:hypothetical protein
MNFKKRAICIDLGHRGDAQYFPADHLYILPWQVVRPSKIPKFVAKNMLDNATRRPNENEKCIMDYALSHLGIKLTPGSPGNQKGKPQLKVRHFSTLIELDLSAMY